MIQLAEDLGFDGVWIAEHHFRTYGVCPSIMPFAAFVAARTTKVKIGAAVVVLPFHNPLRAAEEAAEVDILSKGRLMYGFGRGYQAIEFNGFNVSLEEARARTDEAVEIMKLAWTQDDFSYDGRFTKVENLTIMPKPIQKPHPPLWTAAVSPETIGHYAAKGIPFITDPIATLSRVRRSCEEWLRVAKENGHDVTAPPLGALRGLIIAETEKEARQMAEHARAIAQPPGSNTPESAPIEKTGQFAAGYYYWKDRYLGANLELDTDFFWNRTWIAGDPDRVRGIIKDLEEWGIRHILFNLGDATATEENRRTLKLFAESVMPYFRDRKATPSRSSSGNPVHPPRGSRSP